MRSRQERNGHWPRLLQRSTGGLLLAISLCICTPALAAATSAPPPPSRPPFVPTRDSEVLQQVPVRDTPELKKIYALQTKLKATPHDLKTALELARAYVIFGRSRGDAHYAGYAEATMAPWMAQDPPPPKALVMHATILQFLHKFKAAQAELEQALAANPGNAQAWLTLAFVQMIQGKLDEAHKSCYRLANSGGPFLGIVCSATMRSFTGHAKQAYDMLAIYDVDSKSVPNQYAAWIESLRAECAQRLGERKTAARHFRLALGYTPNDNFLLVNYADLLLDQGKPREVIKLLGNHLYSDTAFLRYALAEQAIGSPDIARYEWIMRARFAALAARGSTLYQREHSRFVLHMEHDPRRALELARRNWRVQRAPWDVRVYLEAALAAGKPKAAEPVLTFLRKYQLQDPVINRLAKRTDSALKDEVAGR